MSCDDVGLGVRLQRVVAELGAIVAGLDPQRIDGADAANLTAHFARAERLAAAGKTLTADRATDARIWAKSGARSPHHWLAALSGTSPGDARAQLDTATRLQALPAVEHALRSGQLSPSQADHITRAAHHDPSTQTRLLQAATHNDLAGLQHTCRQIHLAATSPADDAARYRRIHESRYLRTWTDTDGAGRLSARLTPDTHARFLATLKPFQDRIFNTARRHNAHEALERYAADALTDMAATAAAALTTKGHPPAPPPGTATAPGGPAGTPSTPAGAPAGAATLDLADTTPATFDPATGTSGDATCTAPTAGGGPPGAGEGVPGPPAMVIAVIDHQALTRGHATTDERSYIDGIGPVPVTTIRALTTDAFLAAVTSQDHDIRQVIHLGRQPTAAQRTALTVRDPTCVIPGCSTTHGLEIDHVDGWANTHTTTIDRLARLCHHHHYLKTYEGWTLTGTPGHWQWHPPPPGPFDDDALFAHPPP